MNGNQDSFSVSGGLPKNGKRRTKVPSGGLLKNGKRRTKVRLGFLRYLLKNGKNQNSFRVGFRRTENPKINLGWVSEERKKKTNINGLDPGSLSYMEFRRSKTRLDPILKVQIDFGQMEEPRFVWVVFRQIKESRFVQVDFRQIGELRFVRGLPNNEKS
ncbi:hypothetical protein RhiirB3_439708 [Rhizophagus irregularis]|nr:hypothetical protein RhiirB3_439708 [Rhizophagus irregularis]